MKSLLLSLCFLGVFALVAQKKQILENVHVSNTKAVFLGSVKPEKESLFRVLTAEKKSSNKKQKQLPPNFIGRGKSKVTRPELEHQGADPIRQSQFSRRASTVVEPLVNIDGLSNNFGSPHDPTGSVGLNHYVQAINATTIGVYDKTGNLESSFVANSLWTPLGETSRGDPIVLYAHESDQWIITEFADPAILLFAVSETSDPLGNYSVYSFATPQFPDYPKYGIWEDYVVVTTNESGPGTLHQYFLDKAALLAGEADVTIQRVSIDGNGATEAGFYVTTPVHWNGVTPPIDNNPIAMKINDSSWGEVADDVVEVFSFDVDLENVDNTTVTLTSIETTPFDSYPCDNESGGFACLSQGEGAGGLDAIPEVIMNIPHYRNFGTHESIVLNFVTDVTDGDNLSGIRWMELRRTEGGDWTLYQEGTFAPDDGLHRYMGSIAIDESGNIALAYAVSGPTTFAGLRFTGRFEGDPLGEMTVQETTVVDGTNSIATDRFGDYAHMTVDPVDGQTFWYTAEYGGNGSNNSLTRILAYQLEKKDNDLAVAEISSPETSGDLGETESVVATIQNVGNLDATDFDLVLSLDGSEVETFNYAETLTAGETYEHTFSNTVDLSAIGEYVIEVTLDYSGDESAGNNTRQKTVKKLAAVDGAISLSADDETCAESVVGTIQVTNEGDGTLTSLEIETFVGDQTQEMIAWTGSLETGESESIEAAFSGLSAGDNTLRAVILSANGTDDQVASNDEAQATVALDEGLEQVSLILTTDDFPNETRWGIFDGEGELLFTGGPYGSTDTFTENFCLEADLCYQFLIVDSEGDGICCGFGEGSYALVDAEGNTLFESNGDFGASETTTICIGDAPQNDAEVDVYEVDETVCTTDFVSQVAIRNLGEQILTSADIEIEVNGTVTDNFQWDGSLGFGEVDYFVFNYQGLAEGENDIVARISNPNNASDDGTGDNSDSQVIVVESDVESENLSLVILLDGFPEETSWQLSDDTEEVIYTGGTYPGVSGQIIESLCVPVDGCYELEVFDAFGDGICCDFGDGNYSLLKGDGSTIFSSDGSFGSAEANDFCLGESCNLTVELSKTNVIGAQLGMIMVTASGGTGYEYSIDDGVSFQESNVFDNLTAGEYTVVVRDDLGCTAQAVITLETECQLSIQAESEVVTSDNGTIIVIATGGLDYEYSIDGGVTFTSSNVFENLTSGEYTIIVRSNDGVCSQELTINVDFVLGVIDELQDIVVSPNPTTGLFKIALQGHNYIDDFLAIEVYDVNGRLIQERRFSRYNDEFQGEISLYAYPAGVYVLKPINVNSDKIYKVIKK